MHNMGTALIVVLFMTYEVRSLVAIFQMTKLVSEELGTFLWSQSYYVGWSAVLVPFHQTAKLSTLSTFYTGKAKKFA